MNLAKQTKDLLKENKKLELAKRLKGVKVLATRPVYTSLIPGPSKSGRDLTHANGMHVCL